MAGDRRRAWGSVFGLLGAGALGCGSVDMAGTLAGQAGQGGTDQVATPAAAGHAGTSAVEREDPDAGERRPSEGLTCIEGSAWLLFMQADPLAALEQPEATGDALQLFYVNEQCTFWVLDGNGSGQMRTGTLESAQAQAIWADLGTEARADLPRDEGTSRIGPVWVIKDGTDELQCLGECVSDSVDPGIRALFEAAGRWVQDLFARGEPFEGNVDDIGLPEA
jgi:hypothetical protein